MVQPIILEKLEELPEQLQAEVLHYIEFLLEKHTKKTTLEEIPKQPNLASSMKGRFRLPLPEDGDTSKYGYGSLTGQIEMSDDFNEPLEDLQDYM